MLLSLLCYIIIKWTLRYCGLLVFERAVMVWACWYRHKWEDEIQSVKSSSSESSMRLKAQQMHHTAAKTLGVYQTCICQHQAEKPFQSPVYTLRIKMVVMEYWNIDTLHILVHIVLEWQRLWLWNFGHFQYVFNLTKVLVFHSILLEETSVWASWRSGSPQRYTIKF